MKEEAMKKKDIYELRDGLELTNFEHPRVTYAINKNKRLVATAIKDMEKYVKPTKEMQAYIEQRESLAKKHALKDTNGNPKLKYIQGAGGKPQTVYDIPGQDDPKSKYRKELDASEKKNKILIDAHNEKIRKYQDEFLDDETEFKPYTIDLKVLVDNEKKCPQKTMDMIHWIIKE